MLVAMASVACLPQTVHAGLNIAVIDQGGPQAANDGVFWCDFFEQEGHNCTLFPGSGPTGPLDSFHFVANLSELWSDPDGLLQQHMQRGRGLILRGRAPFALGIDSNPTVQDMIGANQEDADFGVLITVATDPILGNTPPGSPIDFCGDSLCNTVEDTTGHPNAKVLARFQNGSGSIGLLRNRWETGQAVYFTNHFGPGEILRRTIAEIYQPIPAASS
jgi:hypothetical protein